MAERKQPLGKIYRVVMLAVLALLIVTSVTKLAIAPESHHTLARWMMGIVIFSPLFLLVIVGIRFAGEKKWSVAYSVMAILVVITLSIIVGLK